MTASAVLFLAFVANVGADRHRGTMSGGESGDAPLGIVIERFLRDNIGAVVIGAIVMYVIWTRVVAQYQSMQANKEQASARLSDEELRQSVLRARQRQQAYIAEQTKLDAEVRRQREEHEREERARIAEEIQMKKLQGPTTASPAQPPRPATAPQQVPTPQSEQQRGPLSRLPKLPGGERDSYRPSTVQSSGNGGHYKPSGPNCRKRGG